jgi:hypothetical protein
MMMDRALSTGCIKGDKGAINKMNESSILMSDIVKRKKGEAKSILF